MAAPSPPSLPVRLGPFVGRQADLERLLELIQDPSIRLVTLVGPGGIGKSRLALELAGALRGRLENGAIFVPLAQLRSIDELLPALAQAVGVQLPPGGDLQLAVLQHLGSQHLLLVLDNFEHLLDEAPLVADLLIHASRVRVLVTSREKLHLDAETVYHLRGLDVPPPKRLRDPQEYDAVRLFLQRARQARPGLTLDAANAPSIMRLCELVDGNPLGILLAAAWLEHFSPAHIADEISRSLDFLTGEARDAEPRHASMRAVLDSSFGRLDSQLQAVFQSLAVFRGGFDLGAARAVASADLRSLIALVDKSLLTRDPDTGRYDLHELLRHYAHERLAAAGGQAGVVAAHAGYYLTFVSQREARLISPAQNAALNEIQANLDNIRQAWAETLGKRDFAAARAAIPGLYAFCDMRSRLYEGEEIFRLASEGLAPHVGESPHPAWAMALLSWYDMQAYVEPLESFEEITLRAQQCLEQALSVRDAQATAASLVLLGAIAEDQDDFEAAIQHYQAGMQAFPLLDDAYFVNVRIALCHQALRDYPAAIAAFRVSLQRSQETGEGVKTAWCLMNIGDTLLMQARAAEAWPYLDEACTLFEAVGTTLGILWCKYCLSRAAIALGDRDRGRELARTASRIAQQIHSASWIGKTDDLLRKIDPADSGASRSADGPEHEAFSPRELEVLKLLKSEMTGPAIAGRLVISLNTVRYHTKNIYQKLGVNTRLEAIRRAHELGL